MKKSLLFVGLLVLGSFCNAAQLEASDLESTAIEMARPHQWSCHAQGNQPIGGPINSGTLIVSGHGMDRNEAFNRALNNCFNHGLQMCVVIDCYQN